MSSLQRLGSVGHAGVMFAHRESVRDAYIHLPNVEMVTWGNIIHYGSEQAECAHLS